MRWKAALIGFGLTPLVGCNLAYYTTQTLIKEPCYQIQEFRLHHRLRREARSAWREVKKQYPAKTFTEEFEEGFIDGFADYLDRGGNIRPPAVPPHKYRKNKYLTPCGQALARDYLLGFSYGADAAAATGCRQYLTVPVLLQDAPTNPMVGPVRMPEPPATSTDPLDPRKNPPDKIPSVIQGIPRVPLPEPVPLNATPPDASPRTESKPEVKTVPTSTIAPVPPPTTPTELPPVPKVEVPIIKTMESQSVPKSNPVPTSASPPSDPMVKPEIRPVVLDRPPVLPPVPDPPKPK